MYLDEICGSWMDSPFWQKSFLVRNDADLKTIKGCPIKEVWIDTQKGKDISSRGSSENEIESESRTDQALAKVARQQADLEPRISFEAELEQAKKIQTRATAEVSTMFREVRMGGALRAENALPLTNEIYLSVVRNPGALISLTRLKTKNNYTYMHSVAVCALMIALARQMGLEEDETKLLGMAGLLHDVGKIAIAEEILDKPGRLTDDEFNLIKTHPERGWEMLKDSVGVDDVSLDVCLHHHERMDGKGYPEKLDADSLSMFAKMGAVCDVYDAISSDRSYKEKWTPAESIRKMASWKDGHFDALIFDSFVKTIGIYPVGSLLKLKSGRLGVVVGQSDQSLLRPAVKVFFSTTAKSHIKPLLIDLGKTEDEVLSIEEPSLYGFNMQEIVDRL